MFNMMDPGFVALHSQHTLQYSDWMTISNLAKSENIDESLDSWDFEDFLGLAVYMFVTTQSQDTRIQLSQLLPKFGSAAVLPLLKILCKRKVFVEQGIPTLAQQSLNTMSPYPLAIGLNQALNLKSQADLKIVALQTLKQLFQSYGEPSTRLVLSQLLSEANRQLVCKISDSKIPFREPSTVNDEQHKSDLEVAAPRVVQCV